MVWPFLSSSGNTCSYIQFGFSAIQSLILGGLFLKLHTNFTKAHHYNRQTKVKYRFRPDASSLFYTSKKAACILKIYCQSKYLYFEHTTHSGQCQKHLVNNKASLSQKQPTEFCTYARTAGRHLSRQERHTSNRRVR
jgi:hypothetical protein